VKCEACEDEGLPLHQKGLKSCNLSVFSDVWRNEELCTWIAVSIELVGFVFRNKF